MDTWFLRAGPALHADDYAPAVVVLVEEEAVLPSPVLPGKDTSWERGRG